MLEKAHKYGVLVGKPVGRRPPGKTWHRCRDNIKMDHKEIQCEYVEYTHVASDKDKMVGFCDRCGSIKCEGVLQSRKFYVSLDRV